MHGRWKGSGCLVQFRVRTGRKWTSVTGKAHRGDTEGSGAGAEQLGRLKRAKAPGTTSKVQETVQGVLCGQRGDVQSCTPGVPREGGELVEAASAGSAQWEGKAGIHFYIDFSYVFIHTEM